MKKILGIPLVILALPLAFAWTSGVYIKNDVNKIYKGGSVYGVEGRVIGPPPEPLPVVRAETTIPIEPIKEVEQPGLLKRIFYLIRAIVLGR